MDRFSNLPDEIICHIASYLSAKEAAFTTVLSKRFQNLFTIIPNLHYSDLDGAQGKFKDFLNGVLDLPASSRIGKFSLECRSIRTIDRIRSAHVKFSEFLKRGVTNLEVDMSVKEGFGYSLPLEVFSCKTVVVLKLGTGLVINVLPQNAFFPALETLYLDSVQFQDLRGCAFQSLLSACTVLKELTINGVDWEYWKWSRTISSPTLQRLTIERSEYDDFDGSDFGSISFDTPSLVFLDYSDFVPDEYPTVNLDSLVEAKLDLILSIDHYWVEVDEDEGTITSNPTNLIQGLRNVEKLDLISTAQMFYLFRRAIPVFQRLSCLSFSTHMKTDCWRFLPVLLKKAPNLKTLLIKGSLHIAEFDKEPEDHVCKCLAGYSFLLSCPVEVLEIPCYWGDMVELVQVKHFLEKLSCLKLLKVCVMARMDDKEKLRFTKELRKLHKSASSKCEIKIEFS